MGHVAVHRRQLLRTVLGGAVLTGTATGATADSDGAATGPTVYFGAGETVYAVDAATGKSVWTFTAESPNRDTVTITSEPTVVDGTIYVGAGAMLCALDAATGDVEWRTDVFTGHIPNAPTVVDGSVFLGGEVGYVEDHRALRVFDTDTGTQRWTFDSPREVTSSANVVDDTAYSGVNRVSTSGK